MTDTTIVVPDENGSNEEFTKLKEIINNAHVKLYGKSLDTHWTEPDRFFTEKTMKNFLAKLNLPYEIKSVGKGGKRTTTIKKITL